MPLFDPLTHLVFSCAKSDVRHVFVGGRQVVRDGALTRLDLAETLAEVAALAPRIAASVARERGRRGSPRRWPRSPAGPGAPAEVALILGSGSGGLAGGGRATPVAIPYAEIAGFPVSTAPGHAGRLVIGRAARPAGGADAGAAASLRGLGAAATSRWRSGCCARLGARRGWW